MSACVSERAVFLGMCIDFFFKSVWVYDTLFSYHVHIQLNLFVMLFSLYRVSAEEKFHLFACIKNGNKEILN
jgi:hypothetical protein